MSPWNFKMAAFCEGLYHFSFMVRPNTVLCKEYDPNYITYTTHCIGFWILYCFNYSPRKNSFKGWKALDHSVYQIWLLKIILSWETNIIKKKAGRSEWKNLIITEIIFYSPILVYSVPFCLYVLPSQLSKDKNGVGKIEKKIVLTHPCLLLKFLWEIVYFDAFYGRVAFERKTSFHIKLSVHLSLLYRNIYIYNTCTYINISTSGHCRGRQILFVVDLVWWAQQIPNFSFQKNNI